jgi:hypothetical protein
MTTPSAARGSHSDCQAQHDRLRFSDHPKRTLNSMTLGAPSRDHQARVQEAGEGIAFAGHAAHGGIDHFAHDALVHLGRDHRRR